jgi:hypothetical protein
MKCVVNRAAGTGPCFYPWEGPLETSACETKPRLYNVYNVANCHNIANIVESGIKHHRHKPKQPCWKKKYLGSSTEFSLQFISGYIAMLPGNLFTLIIYIE